MQLPFCCATPVTRCESIRDFPPSAGARDAAIELLGLWIAEPLGRPLDRVVAAGLRNRPYLRSWERRSASELVYLAVRYWRRLEWVCDRAGMESGAVEILCACCATLASGCPTDEPGTEALRRAAEQLPAIADRRAYLRIALSYPDHLAEALESIPGLDAVAAGEALNLRAPQTLRVNTLRTSLDRALSTLPGSALQCCWAPWGVEIPAGTRLASQSGKQTGWFEPQDESSQLAALLLDAQPGETVVDACAGAGGKSLALAAAMANRGRIVALDIDSRRLKELERRAARAGARCITPLAVQDAGPAGWQPSPAGLRTFSKLWGAADRVLVDAPCSGSGAIRRSPDLKWRPFSAEELRSNQAAVLHGAALLTRPGGILVYATCAIEPDQNERIVEDFLRSEYGRRFRLQDAPSALAQAASRLQRSSGGEQAGMEERFEQLRAGLVVRSWPHLHGMDGFFMARLMRLEK